MSDHSEQVDSVEVRRTPSHVANASPAETDKQVSKMQLEEFSMEELRAAEEFCIMEALEQLVDEGLLVKKMVGGEEVYECSEAALEWDQHH